MSLPIFGEILILVTAAFFGGFLARTAKLPPVVGYIASGVLFGLLGSRIFPSYSALLDLSQIGVALLLFTLGFEISLESLKRINSRIFLVGILQVVGTALVFFPLLLLFKFNPQTSFLFSLLFSFSSTAVVVKLLEERGLLNDFPGNHIFIFLLIQDLFVIPLIFFLPVLFAKTAISLITIWIFLVSLARITAIFFLIFLIGKFFVPKLMSILFRYPSHELNILATIFVSAGSIGILTNIGIPLSIASFLAGIVISEEGKNIAPLTEIRPLRDIFLVLFFVTTGMLINSSYVISHITSVVFLTITLLLLKFGVMYVILRFSGYLPSSSVFIASYLANIGEFAAVLGQVSFLSGFISKGSYNILLSSFVFSLILVPFSVKYLRVVGEKLSRFPFLGWFLGETSSLTQQLAGVKKVQDHVVICGHGRVGSKITHLLDLVGIEYAVVDFNRKVISHLVARRKHALYGDPTDPEVLRGAGIEAAKVLVVAVPDTISQKKIVKTALSFNKKLVILCRSHFEEDRYELLNMGVNSIVIPEFEAGLRIGVEVLRVFGIQDEAMQGAARKLRKEFFM